MFGVKFRPLTFNDVFGSDFIKSTLSNIIKIGEYDPGYLFTGPFSSGKTTISRIFARSILCLNRQEDMSPCNKCSSCRAFLEDKHPGYLEIDAANNGSKDRVKDIKESLKLESLTGIKIIHFDEAHNISKEGKDALLAQLELLDSNVIIIFCTTEPDKMPKTLSSRCLSFQFLQPLESDIIKKLEKICRYEKIEYDKEALHTIVRSTGRHYRDAENKLRQISLLGQVSFENVNKMVTLYDKEISMMIMDIPEDLSSVLKISDYLVAHMDVNRVYYTILRLLNDSIKFLNGVTFESVSYTSILKDLKNKYGTMLFELLDYILNKNKLNDLTFFQSDLLILHYKFQKGGIKFKPFDAPKRTFEKKEDDTVSDERAIIEDKNLQPWERDNLLRELKMKRLNVTKENKVKEKVSEKWGPEQKENIPKQFEKNELSSEDFGKIVNGSKGAEKI